MNSPRRFTILFIFNFNTTNLSIVFRSVDLYMAYSRCPEVKINIRISSKRSIHRTRRSSAPPTKLVLGVLFIRHSRPTSIRPDNLPIDIQSACDAPQEGLPIPAVRSLRGAKIGAYGALSGACVGIVRSDRNGLNIGPNRLF